MQVTAAAWSAVSATFSFLTAVLAFRLQRRIFFENVRPDLMLLDWDRRYTNTDGEEVLVVGRVKNVGKGPAYHVTLGQVGNVGERPAAIVMGGRTGIIAPSEDWKCMVQIRLLWTNAMDVGNNIKFISVPVIVFAWDSAGRRHLTEYTLSVTHPKPKVDDIGELALGVRYDRRARARAIWTLRVEGWFKKHAERLRRGREGKR